MFFKLKKKMYFKAKKAQILDTPSPRVTGILVHEKHHVMPKPC